MTGFFKKTFIKCSLIATLGLSAYLVGFSWGLKTQPILAADSGSENELDAAVSPLVLPYSEKTTNLSQLK